jgi:DNA-binding FadR family transcriptional regulator
MIAAAGSSLVGTLVGLATELLKPSLAERLPPAFRQLAVEQRAAIVEAIAVGEPEAARGAVELHLNTLAKALETVEPSLNQPSEPAAIAS